MDTGDLGLLPEGVPRILFVYRSFAFGIHNHRSDRAFSRSPTGGPEAIERALSRLSGHALDAYNRVVSCITGEVCKEVMTLL